MTERMGHDPVREIEHWVGIARAVARDTLAPLAAQVDQTADFAPAAVAALRDSGLVGLPVPTAFGGPGIDLSGACRVLEAIGGGCMSTALLLTMHWISLFYLGRWAPPAPEGSESLALGLMQERVFANVIRHGALVANCYGEPGSGTNIPLPFTRATPRDNGWILEGRKLATLARHAEYLQLHAAIHDGGTCTGQIIQFIIPRSLTGVRIESLGRTVGVRAAAADRVILDKCYVAGEYRFGPINEFLLANDRFPYATLLISAPYLGLAQAALDYSALHLRQRRIQGLDRTAADIPHVQYQVGQLVTQVAAARALLEQATSSAPPFPSPERRVLNEAAKAFIGDMVLKVTSSLLQLGGMRMLLDAFPMERYLRDALAAGIHPPMTPEAVETVGRLFLGVSAPTLVSDALARLGDANRPLPVDKLPIEQERDRG